MVHSCFFSPDGHFITILDLCYSRGEDPHDVEYIWRAISDLVKVMEYNSSLNRLTGYTPIGIHKAEQLNADPVVLASFQTPLHFFCKHYGAVAYEAGVNNNGEQFYGEQFYGEQWWEKKRFQKLISHHNFTIFFLSTILLIIT
jgi:hypothetical protein